ERYVKPFRLYLFTSIVFFFLAAIFWPQLGVNDGSSNGGHTKLPIGAEVTHKPDPGLTRGAIQKALQQVDDEPIAPANKAFAKSVLQDELAALDAPPAASKSAPATTGTATHKPAVVAPVVAAPAADSRDLTIKAGGQDVGTLHVNTKGIPKAEADNSFTQMFMAAKDNPDEFKKRFIQNLPKLMFVLMPLIALFLKLFYIGSKRYLTEHFVFTLHFHAMVFTVMLLVMLAGSLAKHFVWAAPLKSAGTVAWWYIAIYLFLALRFFYKQGWFMTGLKFFMIFI